MRVVVLVENRQDKSGVLAHERGLSLYIETNGKALLFDTGKTDAFMRNAAILGIDIEGVDIVVVSHGHNDHVGGLLSFFERNRKAVAYMKKEALDELYFQCMFVKHKVSAESIVYKKYNKRIVYAKNRLEIAKNIFLITSFKMTQDEKNFLRKVNGRYMLDTFDHELIMVVKDSDGLIIFTGCAHNGVTNIVNAAQGCFPGERIKALLGGFHLMRMPRLDFMGCRHAEVSAISELLARKGVGAVYTGHCTGRSAYRKMNAILGERVRYLKIGLELDL